MYAWPTSVPARGATDHKTHGSDHNAVLSHGSDHFSDQQKKKRETNKTLLSIYSVKYLKQGTFAHGLKLKQHSRCPMFKKILRYITY